MPDVEGCLAGLLDFIVDLTDGDVTDFSPVAGPVLAPMVRSGADADQFIVVELHEAYGELVGAGRAANELTVVPLVYIFAPLSAGMAVCVAAWDAIWSALVAASPSLTYTDTGGGKWRVGTRYQATAGVGRPQWSAQHDQCALRVQLAIESV